MLLCSQDAALFNATLRENLLLARRDATEQDILDALAAVELESWALSLPDGLDTLLGADGQLTSGGQRQRIALARALLADTRFLILDEPTAHLYAALARRHREPAARPPRAGRPADHPRSRAARLLPARRAAHTGVKMSAP